jgi:glutathione peroxidase
VNVASRCGFTPQYKDLEALYRKYQDKGFVILGFPSNDFLSQEPGSNEEIKKFCKAKYDVTFPLFEKNPVSGSDKQPLYKFLTEQSGPQSKGEIQWNFTKFLVNRQGQVVARYEPAIKPMSPEVIQKVQETLK